MEEMLKKFYAEYEECYTRQIEALNMLDAALKHPEMFGADSIRRWKSSHSRHYGEVLELRRIARIFGIDKNKLEEIENRIIDNLC